jgi:hypothetical protein
LRGRLYGKGNHRKDDGGKPRERSSSVTVDEFAEVLVSESLQFIQEGHYSNSDGQTGYRAIYRDSERYLWFSVSGTEITLAPDEVAVAIQARGRWVQRENPYFNRNGQQGFEATVHSGGHAFMLGAAPEPPRFR